MCFSLKATALQCETIVSSRWRSTSQQELSPSRHVHVVEAFVTKGAIRLLGMGNSFREDSLGCLRPGLSTNTCQQECRATNVSMSSKQSVTISTTLTGISKTYAGISMVRRCASAVFSPLAGVKMAEHSGDLKGPRSCWGLVHTGLILLGALFEPCHTSGPQRHHRMVTKKKTIWVWTGQERRDE